MRKNDSGDLVYDFVIRDHLGNTRTTFTTETAPALVYKATMESENDSDGNSIKAYEERFFYNLDNSRVNLPTAANVSTLADDKCTDCNESAAVNGATNPIGPAIILDVMPGDELDLEVWAYAEGAVPNNTPLISALTNAFVPAGAGSELGTQTSSILNAESAAVLASGSISTTVVNAYLNYVVFDQTFDAIDYGHQKIGGTINMSQLVSLNNITITEKGYIQIWVSNESDYDLNVFFDDLKVTHTKGPILQEDHYYPFGMSISALSSTAPLSKPNNFKYNGFEEQTEFDLGWYDYQARFYDPQLGRFMQVDPAADLMRRHSPYNYAFDNPIRFIDPDGMMATEGEQCPDGNCETKTNRTLSQEFEIGSKGKTNSVTIKEEEITRSNSAPVVTSNGDGTFTEVIEFRTETFTTTATIDRYGKVIKKSGERISTAGVKKTTLDKDGKAISVDIVPGSSVAEIDNFSTGKAALKAKAEIITGGNLLGIEVYQASIEEKPAMNLLQYGPKSPEGMNFVEFGMEVNSMSGSSSAKKAIINQQMKIDSLERAISKQTPIINR